MVLEDVVDYSADPVPKAVFHYSLGDFGLGASSANCWGDGFIPASLQTDLGGTFSPSFFFADSPLCAQGDPAMLSGDQEADFMCSNPPVVGGPSLGGCDNMPVVSEVVVNPVVSVVEGPAVQGVEVSE